MNAAVKRRLPLLLGAVLLIVGIALSWGLGVRTASLRATLEATLAICGVAGIVCLWGPWTQSPRVADLLALAALLSLVLVDLEFFAAPAIIGSRGWTVANAALAAARPLVAALFAAAALVPRGLPQPRRSQTIMLFALVVIWPVALGLAQLAVPAFSGDSSAARETQVAILFTVPALLVLSAGVAGFVQSSLRDPARHVDRLLGAVGILVVGAWTYSLLVPAVDVHKAATSICLRALCFGLILILGVKVRSQHRQVELHAVVARERRRLAGYLHDGMAQDLALIAAYGDRLADDLGVEHPVAQAARRALAAARGAIIDLSASQEPSAADALRAVAGELAHRHGVQVDVTASPEHLVGEEREAVVRIAREAITNAVKHGGAQHVTITLETRGDQLRLEIDDDGCGLGPLGSAGRSVGHGFREMSEWAHALGGHLTAQQGAHGGTAVKVLVT